MRILTLIYFVLGFSSLTLSQVFTYNGSYSIGVNTGTAVYQYITVNGQEIKNGTFSFIDKVDNYTVSGNYNKGEKSGDWTEVRKLFTYNDWPTKKADLIMSNVVKNNPYKETTVTLKSKYNADKSRTEVETKNVLLQWGYPSAGTSNWSVTVTRKFDIKGELIAVEGSYTDNAVKKSAFKGALNDGYGVGNWEIMDRPGYTDIFKFENYRIVSRTRIDNLTKKTVETVVNEENSVNVTNGIDYKGQYKIRVEENEGTLYIKEISPDVLTYKTVEYLRSFANFSTMDMKLMSSLFDEMLPTGFAQELTLKETAGFPKFQFEFNSLCDKMNFYSFYTNNYSNWDKLTANEKTVFNIQEQLSVASEGAAEYAFPKNMVDKLYYSDYTGSETVMETMSLLAMAKDWELNKKANSLNPEKLDNTLGSYDLYHDSLTHIIMTRYFQNYTYNNSEIKKAELWKDVLYRKSEELKNCDSVLYTLQFDYLKRIFAQVDSSIATYNQGKYDEALKYSLLKIGDLEFLATDLNVYPKELNSMIIYEYTNQERKLDNLSSLLSGAKKGQMLYSPNTLKTDPCPKGYKIPTVDDFKKVQLTLDYNMDLIEKGGALNFNSDFNSLGINTSYFDTSQKYFLVYNDMKDPKWNNYKFLYFPLDGYKIKEAKAQIDPDHSAKFVKCRCIKE